MCNTLSRGERWVHNLTYVTKDANREKEKRKKILSLIGVKIMFHYIRKDRGEPFNGYTFISSPTPIQCCSIPINGVCDTEEASWHLLHSYNRVHEETLPFLCIHGVKQTHMWTYLAEKSVYWSSRLLLLPAVDIVYTCRLKKQHSYAALCWHPG